jgi:hypothetical protein
VVEAEFVLGGFEAAFDHPAAVFDGDKRLDSRPSRAPCREIGEITVADIAADEKATGSKP